MPKYQTILPGGELPDDLIGTTEACRLAGIHINTLWRWLLQGKLAGWKRGGRVFVSRAELDGMFQKIVPYKDRPHPPSAREQKARKKLTDRILRENGIIQ